MLLEENRLKIEANKPKLISLEAELNQILRSSWEEFSQNKAVQAPFNAIFKQPEHESRKGTGEKPSWSPNEAYMQSLEWLWEPVETYLAAKNLKIDHSLRELFKESREYLDYLHEHRRVFYGQIMCGDIALSAFMLTVPHSHRALNYPAPVTIQISSPLLTN